MLSAIAIIPLLVLIYLRPQEVFEPLQGIPFLYLCSGLAAFGLVVDIRARRGLLNIPPQLPWVLGLVVWIVVSTVIGSTAQSAMAEITDTAIAFILFALIALGAQSLRALRLTSIALVFCVLALIFIGLHLRMAPKGCVLVDESNMGPIESGKPDGRSCDKPEQCYGPDASPGGRYKCEHVGLLGTITVNDRVRYRGILQDPNELAMTIAIGLPLLFALAVTTRGLRWKILAVLGIAAGVVVLIFTQSRTGQLVFLAAVGVYGINRFGLAGAGAAAVLASPAILLGGRSGEEASSSVEERLDAWSAGFEMIKRSPITGVGKGMYVENNYLTAHNSYVLSAAELGIVGYLVWLVVMYLSVKIPFQAIRTLEGPESETARAWAIAILASFAGILVAMAFLSLSFHYMPWIYLGLSGALYTSIVRHDSAWRVRFGLIDLFFVVVGGLGLLVALRLYLRLKGY